MVGHDTERWQLDRRTILQATSATGLALAGLPRATGAKDADQEWDEFALTDTEARFNVGYKNTTGDELARSVATEVHRTFETLQTVTIEATHDGLRELAAADTVRYVEPDQIYRIGLPPQETEVERLPDAADPVVPWGVERISALDAQRRTVQGETAHVAVLDTGIDPTHEALDANVGEGIGVTPCQGDRVPWECTVAWDDDHGHGTHVAGTVAARETLLGVGPEITLHSVKVLNQLGVGFTSDIALGLVLTAVRGYDVANMSFGNGFSRLVQEALEFAADQGVLLVSAAGNDAGPVGYPASADEVIAVSATNQADELAWFSNRGPEIELAAPGVDVLSTLPRGDNYLELSGTSMASPHVAGTAGLLMAAGRTAAEARAAMHETAADLSLPTEQQGRGLVNASAVGTKRPSNGSESVFETPSDGLASATNVT